MPTENAKNEIRRLNDLLRCHGQAGRIMLTSGIKALGPLAVVNILAAVASFDAFDGDNDPHGEHDCAILEVEGTRVLFKIDGVDAPSHGGIAMCQTGFVRSQ